MPGSRGGAMARLAVRDGAIEVEAKVDPGGESDTQFRRSTPQQPRSEIVMKRIGALWD